ncbi:hypothetical protein KCV87_11785 [Actinosynnema pretiosum subsp. pretiosum]|uniref:Uncharacterized protein n=1 Tax=Actinosynnema pretiosum subsp. pretiosum TaxID=103721 RepID=A0AA45R6A3_9PSEU|nr:hypothetical protein KCV87_11785 [Actinosynnema pretiosum subsp. pretiosum]
MFDMDNELDEKSSQVGPRGAVVIPLGESVQRIREPLSRETYENFGQRAFEALEKAEIYDKTESGETRKRPRGL